MLNKSRELSGARAHHAAEAGVPPALLRSRGLAPVYERFYGFKIKPFALLPQEEFMFLSRQHGTALGLLAYSLHNRAMFCVVCGDIGTGKTTLLRYLLSQHEPHISVGMITSTTGTFSELLQWILSEFGLDYHGLGQDRHAAGACRDTSSVSRRSTSARCSSSTRRRHSTADVLEELRLFSNVNAGRTMLLQTVLVGQLSLRDTLRRPQLRQLAQRVAVDYLLVPLDKEQTEAYIRHRLRLAGPCARISSPPTRVTPSTWPAAAFPVSLICFATQPSHTASPIRSRRSTRRPCRKCWRTVRAKRVDLLTSAATRPSARRHELVESRRASLSIPVSRLPGTRVPGSPPPAAES